MTACAPVAAQWCTKDRDQEHEAASGPSAAQGCTKDGEAYRTAAPGPSRTCASIEATGLGARNLWCLVKTIAWPFAGGWRLAAGGWRLAAGGWRLRRTLLFPLDNTSYIRPAPWPPTMHKCARDPALPLAPCCRPLCTLVQRWDPALPRVPRRGNLFTFVQRRARTQSYTHVNTRPPWSVWPGTPSRAVHKGRMRDCQERRGAEPLFSWPGCRGRAPLGVQGAKPPPGVQRQSPARHHLPAFRADGATHEPPDRSVPQTPPIARRGGFRGPAAGGC
jgi:hypothetical protein